MNIPCIMTTRTVPIHTDATTDSKDATSSTAGFSVRFAPAESNVIVPPESDEPLSASEKRSMWYTFKELQVRHQSDVDEVKQQIPSKRRHSLLSPLQQQSSSSAEDDTISYRGLEHIVAQSTNSSHHHHHSHHHSSSSSLSSSRSISQSASSSALSKRNSKVKETVQQIVALHKQAVAKGLPLLNEEVRQGSQSKTKADRQRAERWALQDAKDIGIPSHHSPLRRVGKQLAGRAAAVSPKRGVRIVTNKLSKLTAPLPWGQ